MWYVLNCIVWLKFKVCLILNFSWKPRFSAFKSYPKNPFQNLSIFWGWALKQKCRACRIVQSWFLEFSKLFRKIWSNLKRHNSLNVPFLNSNLHFKIWTELGGGYKSKVVELLFLNNFYFWRFLSYHINLRVNWEIKQVAIR